MHGHVLVEDPGRLGVVQARPMSCEAFLAWTPEGGLAEWVNGEGMQYMPATRDHQRIVNLIITLLNLLLSARRLGKVFSGPYAVQLATGSVREPDVFVVLADNSGSMTERAFVGAPDIVVEVISDDSVYRDRVTKFDEYEAAGVCEYWLIDPRSHRRRADFYARDAHGRFQTIPLREGAIFRSIALKGFWLRCDWLWEDELDLVAIYQIIQRGD
jgi:Uma2 family endonuclease